MDEFERKGTCSVCKAPATYYGDVSQYCISDYEKLRTENQRLREALEFYRDLPMSEHDQHWTQELADKCIKVAKQALAETEG